MMNMCSASQPSLGLLDRQAQGQLFQADRVAGVLGIDRIDDVVFRSIYTRRFSTFDAAAVFVGLALRVQKAEKIVAGGL
jgi:hypothetical protein